MALFAYEARTSSGEVRKGEVEAPSKDDARNNCTCWAVHVDGAYHTCVVTTRAVAAREELAYDYGEAYWAPRGGVPSE